MIRNTKHRTLPEVVKLVDAADSKSAVRDDVSVRVRPSGPRFKDPKLVLKAWGFLMLIILSYLNIFTSLLFLKSFNVEAWLLLIGTVMTFIV